MKQLSCNEYIIVPGYNKTLLFTFNLLQHQFKYFALLKTLPELLSFHRCANAILNHIKLNKMPIYSNIQNIYEQKIVKIFLKYLEYEYEYDYTKQCIPF